MANTDSEELMWARNEVRSFLPTNSLFHSCKSQFKATLAALEADLEDLEESVKCFAYSTSPFINN